MWLRSQVTDMAGFLGLTRRVATFKAPYRAVVDSPLHDSFAIFTRP
jgi:hypothetical protein